jgi:hypothetical protein
MFDFGDFAGELIACAGLHVVLLVVAPRERRFEAMCRV